MLTLFSTRELAMGIYVALILAYSLCHEKSRKAWIPVIKTALTPKLSITAGLLAAIGMGFAIFTSRFSFWDNIYYKDVVMWILFVGWPLCFGAISSKENQYFRNAVIDNIKITVLFECIFSTFTFPLWIELILIPSTTAITLLEMVANRDSKTKPAAKFLSGVLALIGLVVLAFTVKTAASEFKMDMAYGMLASIVIPLVLSAIYVPFAYLLALYAAYELSFLRMKFCEPDKPTLRLWHRLKALIFCNFSLAKARMLQKSAQHMYKSMTEKEFNAYLKSVRNESIKRNGKTVEKQ